MPCDCAPILPVNLDGIEEAQVFLISPVSVAFLTGSFNLRIILLIGFVVALSYELELALGEVVVAEGVNVVMLPLTNRPIRGFELRIQLR